MNGRIKSKVWNVQIRLRQDANWTLNWTLTDLSNSKKDDLRIHEKQEQAINGISNYIVHSTSVAYLPLIDGLDTVHERLQALKTALAPTTSGRKHDVLIQYTALRAYDTTQSIEKWLNSWRNIYKLAEQLELPDVQGFRPHYDFVRVIKPISSSFAGALEVDLIQKERMVGYRCRANNVVAGIVYSLFLLLVYAEIVLVFGIEPVVGSELVLV